MIKRRKKTENKCNFHSANGLTGMSIGDEFGAHSNLFAFFISVDYSEMEIRDFPCVFFSLFLLFLLALSFSLTLLVFCICVCVCVCARSFACRNAFDCVSTALLISLALVLIHDLNDFENGWPTPSDIHRCQL